MEVSLQKLQNGIPVLLSRDDHASTACVLVGVGIGSNHEADTEYGMAHFFEHMCFKGTKTYPEQKDLLTHLDGLGVVSNAFTDHEYTAYYTHGDSQQLSAMLQVTADIFLHSRFAEEDVEKEKRVIVEEISMYEDDPVTKSSEVVARSLFAGTALGHAVIGTTESVSSFSRDQFLAFFKKQYVTGNMIISVAGSFDEAAVLRELNELYASAPAGDRAAPLSCHPTGPQTQHTSIVRNDAEQMRITIAGYAPSWQDSDRFAAIVLATLFGGSMSSRLFLRVREEMGACYDICAYNEMQSVCGMHSISVGVSPARVDEVMDAIADECKKVREELVSDDEVKRAGDQVIGRLMVARESMNHWATKQATMYLQTGMLEDENHDCNFIFGTRSVTAEDVRHVARKLYDPAKMAVCYIGNRAVPKKTSDTFFQMLV